MDIIILVGGKLSGKQPAVSLVGSLLSEGSYWRQIFGSLLRGVGGERRDNDERKGGVVMQYKKATWYLSLLVSDPESFASSTKRRNSIHLLEFISSSWLIFISALFICPRATWRFALTAFASMLAGVFRACDRFRETGQIFASSCISGCRMLDALVGSG